MESDSGTWRDGLAATCDGRGGGPVECGGAGPTGCGGGRGVASGVGRVEGQGQGHLECLQMPECRVWGSRERSGLVCSYLVGQGSSPGVRASRCLGRACISLGEDRPVLWSSFTSPSVPFHTLHPRQPHAKLHASPGRQSAESHS